MHPSQSESSTNAIQSNPDWIEVKAPTPTPLTPQGGWGDEQITYGPYAPTSPGYSGASEDNMDETQKAAKRDMEHAGLSWTACYDDGCFMHLSEKQGRWYPKKPSQHKFDRNTPYQTQPTTPPPPPKPKHGNTREMHAQRVNWDKCYNRRCKTHRQQKEEAGYYPKRGEKAARTPLEEEGGRKLHVRWSDETLVDDNALHQQKYCPAPCCVLFSPSAGRSRRL